MPRDAERSGLACRFTMPRDARERSGLACILFMPREDTTVCILFMPREDTTMISNTILVQQQKTQEVDYDFLRLCFYAPVFLCDMFYYYSYAPVFLCACVLLLFICACVFIVVYYSYRRFIFHRSLLFISQFIIAFYYSYRVCFYHSLLFISQFIIHMRLCFYRSLLFISQIYMRLVKDKRGHCITKGEKR